MNAQPAFASSHIRILSPRDRALAIIADIARRHGTTAETIIGPAIMGNNRVVARHMAVLAVVEAFPKWSAVQVGRLFGGRDHTFVLHIIRKYSRPGASPSASMAAQLSQEPGGDKSNGNKAQAKPPLLSRQQHKELPKCGQSLAVAAQ